MSGLAERSAENGTGESRLLSFHGVVSVGQCALSGLCAYGGVLKVELRYVDDSVDVATAVEFSELDNIMGKLDGTGTVMSFAVSLA